MATTSGLRRPLGLSDDEWFIVSILRRLPRADQVSHTITVRACPPAARDRREASGPSGASAATPTSAHSRRPSAIGIEDDLLSGASADVEQRGASGRTPPPRAPACRIRVELRER